MDSELAEAQRRQAAGEFLTQKQRLLLAVKEVALSAKYTNVYVVEEIEVGAGVVLIKLYDRRYHVLASIHVEKKGDLLFQGANVIQRRINWDQPNSEAYWFGVVEGRRATVEVEPGQVLVSSGLSEE